MKKQTYEKVRDRWKNYEEKKNKKQLRSLHIGHYGPIFVTELA